MFKFLELYTKQLDEKFKNKKLTPNEVFRQVVFVSDYYKDLNRGIIPKKGYVYKCYYRQHFLSGSFIVTDIKNNTVILKPFIYNEYKDYYLTYTKNIEIKARLNKQQKVIFNGGVFTFDNNFNYNLKNFNKIIEVDENIRNKDFKVGKYYHRNYEDTIKIIKIKEDDILIQNCFHHIFYDRTEIKSTKKFEWINKIYLWNYRRLYKVKGIKIVS